MTQSRRFLSSVPGRIFGIGGLIILVLSILPVYVGLVYGHGAMLALAGVQLVAGAWLALVLRQRSRPVLEVSGGAISFGSIFLPRRKSVCLDDVAEVASSNKDTIRLRLRNGQTVDVPLREVRSEQKAEAVELVRESVRVAQEGT
jgi:hypothetical protein